MGRPNDYIISQNLSILHVRLDYRVGMWVGGVQKGQNVDYVIFEWSLIGTVQIRQVSEMSEFIRLKLNMIYS